MIVDDLHIVYRVFGAASDAEKGNAVSALTRLLKRQGRPQMKEVHAVKGVTFVAYHGDAIGIVGRNGSGKSTLLRAIAGLLPPHEGAVYTDGQPSLLGVNAALMRELTGERNIVLGCYAMGMTPAEVRVLRLIADGNANKEIAALLSLSEETVKGQVRNVLAKLGAKDRTHAAMIGFRRGIIEF